MTYIECPLIVVFALLVFIGFAGDKIFTLSGEIEELKSEVKDYAEKDKKKN